MIGESDQRQPDNLPGQAASASATDPLYIVALRGFAALKGSLETEKIELCLTYPKVIGPIA